MNHSTMDTGIDSDQNFQGANVIAHVGTSSSQRRINVNGTPVVPGQASHSSSNLHIMGRRKSLQYQQHQHQLHYTNASPSANASGDEAANLTAGRFSPHPNEIYLHQSGKLSIPPPSMEPPPSPAPNSDRYIVSIVNSTSQTQPQTQHHFQQQPQQQPQNQLISLTSSNSTSSLSTSLSGVNQSADIHTSVTNSQMQHKFATGGSSSLQQRALSPNSRYRHERYRETPPLQQHQHQHQLQKSSKLQELPITCGGSSSSSSNLSRYYMPSHAPLVPSDYTYLSSTVHTPVKRYVPTPPLAHETFLIGTGGDPGVTSQANTTIAVSSSIACGTVANTAQYINTLPYGNYRLKCCSSNDAAHIVGHSIPPPLHGSEAFNTLNKSTQAQCISNANSSSESSCSPMGGGQCKTRHSGTTTNTLSTLSQQQNTQHHGSSGAEYANTSVIGRRINASSSAVEIDNATNSGGTGGGGGGTTSVVGGINSSNTGTCLHCNTARRTTGVHQTTQTTGPISPVPVSQLLSNASHVAGNASGLFCGASSSTTHEQHSSSSMLTPSTTESQISPLSPTGTVLQMVQTVQRDDHVPGYHHQHQQHIQQRQQQQHQQQLPMYSSSQQQQQLQLTNTNKNAAIIITSSHSPRNLQQQQSNMNGQQQLHHHLQQQQQPQQLPIQSQQLQQQQQRRYSRKKRFRHYVQKQIARFFGVEPSTETEDYALWHGRHRRLAVRRFGALSLENETINNRERNNVQNHEAAAGMAQYQQQHSERPDILPAHDSAKNSGADETPGHHVDGARVCTGFDDYFYINSSSSNNCVERKASVAHMLMTSIIYVINALNQRQQTGKQRQRQWSRSFAPIHVHNTNIADPDMMLMGGSGGCTEVGEGALMLVEEEMFFDSPGESGIVGYSNGNNDSDSTQQTFNTRQTPAVTGVGVYMSESRPHGWRTSALSGGVGLKNDNLTSNQQDIRLNSTQNQNQQATSQVVNQSTTVRTSGQPGTNGLRANRISAQLLDGVLENSRRPQARRVKYFGANELDDRTDHRPFFTYWINTVQIVVLCLSILCYGIAPIGFGSEQKTGQVLVTSLSLQTVQHSEQRNFWIGPRNNDLVHMGAKFAACMRRDIRIIEVLTKTRRQERETACCIRNDDSGCVQSSQADCSVRGLFPTKSISTWKKWSPGESGPGGRISGSVCGLDPKFCDAPASIAPYEWPDDITKWPICRKTNSFTQRFRYKDHTAEHMVCEVIGHPCCTGVYGECRITTREYCDFVNGYFHEEASLCSQISCLSNVCGMFPFLSVEVPDQFYRLLTSLCMHAGILHLIITVIVQHIFLADLERLIGPIRTAVVYIGSGLAGNLTSAVLVPYKPEVGPSASLCGVVASLVALLILMHWKQLHKPHVALFKLVLLSAMLFGIGTLPYQLNFAGLLAGVFCGIFLTISLVPFVSINKYGRKAKLNMIWSCVIFHVMLYSSLTIIFYIFPMEFANLNFGGENLLNNLNPPLVTSSNSNIGVSSSSATNEVLSSRGGGHLLDQTQKPQYYFHHHSDDIIRNSAALTIGASKTARRLAHQEIMEKSLIPAQMEEKEKLLYYSSSSLLHTDPADGDFVYEHSKHKSNSSNNARGGTTMEHYFDNLFNYQRKNNNMNNNNNNSKTKKYPNMAVEHFDDAFKKCNDSYDVENVQTIINHNQEGVLMHDTDSAVVTVTQQENTRSRSNVVTDAHRKIPYSGNTTTVAAGSNTLKAAAEAKKSKKTFRRRRR